MLKVDEAPGWGSDAVSTWAEQHSIEVLSGGGGGKGGGGAEDEGEDRC